MDLTADYLTATLRVSGIYNKYMILLISACGLQDSHPYGIDCAVIRTCAQSG